MIWIIAGTKDGRLLGARLADMMTEKGLGSVFMTVVSSYGKELAEHPGLIVEAGRLSEKDMESFIARHHIQLIVDASHPYAAEVTRSAWEAAARTHTDYIRYERPEVPLPSYDQLFVVSSEEEAASRALELGGPVLLTTGSKTLAAFSSLLEAGVKTYARVLPSSHVLSITESLGWRPDQIIAMEGPFSTDMNRVMIRDYGIRVLVTKNSGSVGGSDTKMEAAMAEHIAIIVIRRPRVAIPAKTCSSVEQALLAVKDWLGRKDFHGVYQESQSH